MPRKLIELEPQKGTQQGSFHRRFGAIGQTGLIANRPGRREAEKNPESIRRNTWHDNLVSGKRNAFDSNALKEMLQNRICCPRTSWA